MILKSLLKGGGYSFVHLLETFVTGDSKLTSIQKPFWLHGGAKNVNKKTVMDSRYPTFLLISAIYSLLMHIFRWYVNLTF